MSCHVNYSVEVRPSSRCVYPVVGVTGTKATRSTEVWLRYAGRYPVRLPSRCCETRSRSSAEAFQNLTVAFPPWTQMCTNVCRETHNPAECVAVEPSVLVSVGKANIGELPSPLAPLAKTHPFGFESRHFLPKRCHRCRSALPSTCVAS